MTTAEAAPDQSPGRDACAVTQRALFYWPRLDPRILAECGCDSRKIAGYVADRTSQPIEVVTEILEAGEPVDSDSSWFFG